ncbi:MAG TPA: hypothetical protein VFH62_07115 [Dehalococcoidia bacterium]|nr:hypothetical protein [Dehalococcoidia bacterium]
MLGLLPSAPRELVEEVYWHLTRQTRSEAYSHHAIERLSALNAAYDSIAHTYGDTASATSGALAKAKRAKPKRGMFSRGAPTNPYAAVDLYELMHLDFDADVDLVRVAASVLLPLAQADRQLREQIERAREVLANPDRRAAYDKKSGVARKREKAAKAAAQTDAIGDLAESAVQAASADDAPSSAPDASQAGTAATPDGAGAEARVDGAPSPAKTDRDEEPDDVARPPAEDAVVEGSPDGSGRRGFGLGKWLARNELTPEMIEAENGRVLSLADEDEVWNVPEGEADPAAMPADGAVADPPKRPRREVVLSFVKGPRTGEALTPDGTNEMRADLAGAGGGVHIRVWRSAGVYLLQQLVGPPVLVGGAHIEAPVVVLEDGDEIASGEHVLRFQSPE